MTAPFPQNRYNSSNAHKLPKGRIVEAAMLLTDLLEIDVSKAGNLHLFQLLETYLLDRKLRRVINQTMETALTIERRNLLVRPMKKKK